MILPLEVSGEVDCRGPIDFDLGVQETEPVQPKAVEVGKIKVLWTQGNRTCKGLTG